MLYLMLHGVLMCIQHNHSHFPYKPSLAGCLLNFPSDLCRTDSSSSSTKTKTSSSSN